MTEADIINRLEALIEKRGPRLNDAAKALGYTKWQLSNMRHGRVTIPAPLLYEMGIRRVMVYEEIK